MVCSSCVEKLAYKLLSNHPKLDLIRAFELAEKAVERVERVSYPASKPQRAPPADPDYTQPCGCDCICKDISCTASAQCNTGAGTEKTCTCPRPSVAHSHYVGNDCVVSTWSKTCKCDLVNEVCYGDCTCTCTGNCYYDCDPGYVWNGSECVPAPTAKIAYTDGLVCIA